MASGLSSYFEEVEKEEIINCEAKILKLSVFASEMKTEDRWKMKFQNIRKIFYKRKAQFVCFGYLEFHQKKYR